VGGRGHLTVQWRPPTHGRGRDGSACGRGKRLRRTGARLPRSPGHGVLRVTSAAPDPGAGARRGRWARADPRVQPASPGAAGTPPLDVPKRGLTPEALLRTYNADQLAARGLPAKAAADRCRHLASGTELGRLDGADEPVPAGTWWAPGRGSEPAAVPGRRGRATSLIPQRDSGRQRGRRRRARIRPGDRARHAQRGQPGSRSSRHPEGGGALMTTELPSADEVPTMPCRVCQTDVAAGAFCGLCGARLAAVRGDGRRRLRLGAYGAAPGEHVLRVSVVSSLLPHLPQRSRTPFRMALAVLVIALMIFVVLRWQPPLTAVSGPGLPLLFLVYLYEADVHHEWPIRTLLMTGALGVGLGVGWALLTGSVVARANEVALGTGLVPRPSAVQLFAIPLDGTVLMLLPPVLVRVSRPPSRESLVRDRVIGCDMLHHRFDFDSVGAAIRDWVDGIHPTMERPFRRGRHPGCRGAVDRGSGRWIDWRRNVVRASSEFRTPASPTGHRASAGPSRNAGLLRGPGVHRRRGAAVRGAVGTAPCCHRGGPRCGADLSAGGAGARDAR